MAVSRARSASSDESRGRFEVGRRGLLKGGAVTAAGAVAATSSAPASAAGSYTKTPVPTARERHAINRFTFGFTPDTLAQLRAAGTPERWFTAQLSPATVSESAMATAVDSWWPTSVMGTPQQVSTVPEGGHVAAGNYRTWAMVKRMYSNRQVLEIMSEFWENHFYIPLVDDGVLQFRSSFGRDIKRLALTSFEELLQASTTHAAMNMSLDNVRSKKGAINENLGRELLELHTVGQGRYTEDDVKNSARMLTGYQVKTAPEWIAWYDPSLHHVGELQIMGFTHPNADADGQAATRAYLRYLAHHEATARRICRKLAVRFVSDTPSNALVEDLAGVYRSSGTKIEPVLQKLFGHPEFWDSADKKVRTPTDELITVYRALGTEFAKPPGPAGGGTNQMSVLGLSLGDIPFNWTAPDGPPADNAAWTNPSRFLGSWELHIGMIDGWPHDAKNRPHADWLPEDGITLAEFVDHLSRVLLGRDSTDRLLNACTTSVGFGANEVITSTHTIIRHNRVRHLLSLVLNQPVFYLR